MDVDGYYAGNFDLLGQEYLDLIMGDNAGIWSAGLDYPRYGLGFDGPLDHPIYSSNSLAPTKVQEAPGHVDDLIPPSHNRSTPMKEKNTIKHVDHEPQPSNNSPTPTEQETTGSDEPWSIFGTFLNPVAKTIDLTQVSIQDGNPTSENRADFTSYDENRLLSQVLEIFPDISLAHVAALLQEAMTNFSHETKPTLKARVIERILEDPGYPKQQKRSKKAAEVSSIQDDTRWEREQHHDSVYTATAMEVLMRTFPLVPIPYLRLTMQRGRSLFSAYVELSSFEDSTRSRDRPYTRLVKGRKVDDHSNDLRKGVEIPHVIADEFLKELQAAGNRSRRDADAFRKREEEETAERHNEEEHTRANNLVECQCCYLDVPLNRAIHCEGTAIHFFCFSCIRKNAETQIGLMKYQLQCIDTSGCQAEFSRSTLEDVLGPSLTKKLDSLQQEDEVRRAGLEGLESCPFCEFKAVCAPVEEDREFRCQNPACEEVSCRLCKAISHIPQTCAEAAKEKGIPERRLVEEAMSETLIRRCPHCQVNIVKESGCNKVVCSKCSHVMCYICRQDITRAQYGHFGQRPGSCPTHDHAYNTDEQAVNQAEKRTIDKLIADNPNLTREDLLVHRHKQTKVDPPDDLYGHLAVPRVHPQRYRSGFFQPRPNEIMQGIQYNRPNLFEQPIPLPPTEPRQRGFSYPRAPVRDPRVVHDENEIDPLTGLPVANLPPSPELPSLSFRHPPLNPPAMPNPNSLFIVGPRTAHPRLPFPANI